MTTMNCRGSAWTEGARRTVNHLDHKQVILLFRWLLILIVVAFIISGEEGISILSKGFPLAVAFVVTNVVLSFFPRKLFTRLVLTGPMLVIDIAFVTAAIYVSGNVTGDLYLLYFITIFLAALSRDIKISLLASIAVILLYGWMSSWKMESSEFLTTRFMVRIPFFLLTAIFSGFLASQVKLKEKETEEANLFNVRLQQELKKARKTEEKAREELLALYQHNQNILESLNTAVLVVDPDDVITTFNAEATRITGVVKDAVVGKCLREIPDLAAFSSFLTKVTEEGDTCTRDELTIKTQGGRSVPIGISTSVLRDPHYEPRGAIAIFKDLTELRDLERKLKRSERLALLGEMAASVAHEIRNPLNSISGFAQLICEKTDEEDRRRLFSQIIVEEAQRIERIIGDTLLFSRETVRVWKPVDINEVIKSALTGLSEKAERAGARISLDLDPDLPPAAGNASQLDQVFSNLILNAIQAISNDGEILIATTSSNDSIEATVTDTGSGIPSDVTDTIFHPFFTTKPDGTGLGLSVCSKIIDDHNGNIEVESNPGQGATFKVTLPVFHPEHEPTQRLPEVTPAAREGGQV